MAHCHGGSVQIDAPEGARRIVLVGNPNAGKSVFFNNLTGMYVDVSNYPGTTLEISSGRYLEDLVIDTPGVYGISSFNDEERVARDVILSADVIINVVNAVYLDRDLFLTQQIIDTGIPVIVALNMVDEAETQGLKIDVNGLSEKLGVPVVPTVAISRKGMDELKRRIFDATAGNVDPELEKKLEEIIQQGAYRAEALLILEGDSAVAERCGLLPMNQREEVYKARRKRVNEIVNAVVKEEKTSAKFSQHLNRFMINPVTGVPLLLVVLYAMFKLIGVFVAGTVVGFTEETIMIGYFEPFIRSIVGHFIAESSVLGTILIGEFGLLTMTFTYVFGLLLPLVVGFYFILSLFEDSGYLPRIATLVDRVLSAIGLNGRAVIPIILGFGCVTMATITTRLLGTEREKRIATFLLGLAIPCSAQLGVIAGLLANVGVVYAILYVAVIFAVLVLVGTGMNTILSGKSSDLLIDLPPLRLPIIRNVLTKTWIKSYQFTQEAFPLFALGAFIISVLQVSGILVALQNLLMPLTVNWLGLPKESATAFIMGIVRRDFGAAGLADLTMTSLQTVVSLITITLFVPCIASILVMFKERSKKEGAFMWLSTWVIAFIVGGIVAQIAKVIGTTTSTQVLLTAGVFWGIVLILVFGMKVFQRRSKNKDNKGNSLTAKGVA
jgi:ferrous iron transport protein B